MLPYNEIKQLLVQKDSVLQKVFASVQEPIKPSPSIDIYLSLLNSIASQQLSVKVVDVIWKRFLDLFSNGYPDANSVVMMENAELRSVGLSNSKVNYIKNVAEFALSNDISFKKLDALTDDEIITYLAQIKGVGKWTVQMILMFPMDRPDVFPIDDFGIQNNMKYWYGIDLDKKELRFKLEQIAEQWMPYRSLACKYLWKSVWS